MASEFSEEPIAAVAQFFNSKRKPVTAKDRKAGPFPYYGAAAIQDWVSDYLFDGMFVLVGEDGTVQTGDGKLMVQLAQGKIWVNNHAHVLQCETEDDTRYLAYALTQVDAGPYITGAAQPKINMGNLKRVTVPWPTPDIRTGISAIGRAIDDRIDLLRQTNATLEAIAQALFKSWFVDFDPVRAKSEGREPEGMDAATAALFPDEFEESELGLIPKGWQVGRLGELCQNIRTQAKPGAMDASTPYIGLEHMPRGSIALSDAGTADGLASAKFWYSEHDVLFGKLRPYFHKVGVASHTGVCSTDILVIRASDRAWFGYTTMQLSSDALIAYATRLSNGAKMPRSSWGDIAGYRVVIPPEQIAAAFDGLIRAFVGRIHINIDASRSLAGLRDTLLPRLISGKLRLPEAGEEVEGALV